MPLRLQELIHQLEVGKGTVYLKWVAILVGMIALAVVFDVRAYQNLWTQESMDAAQLGRNISEGKGYVTQFIRPFSMYLIKRARPDKDPLVRQPHPDISNPPFYPVVLAGLLKVAPIHYKAQTGSAPYQPDLWITILNQVLFLVAIFMVLRMAGRLFDPAVAWMSALVFAGSLVFWRFTNSGLSTILLIILFLSLVWTLMELEEAEREGKRGQFAVVLLGGLAGFLVGLGGLTRYAFAWLLLPVLVFLVAYTRPRRVYIVLAALAAFALVMTPWVLRNYRVSQTPFGTSGFVVYEGTKSFPENTLDRTLHPDLSTVGYTDWTKKLLLNSRAIVQNELPRLGGSWITAFFIVGLLLPFRKPILSRLRYFIFMCLVVLVFVQALGKTHLSEESPQINSENLLVLLAPLIFIFGVSLVFVLLDQMELSVPSLRYGVLGLIWVGVSLPLLTELLPPRGAVVAYPPYYPPAIQLISSWMDEDELIMSDIPWAVSWYGDRQSVLLTMQYRQNPNRLPESGPGGFFEINDYVKPIEALYFTPRTLDNRFLSQMIKGENVGWNYFILETLKDREVPKGFPLRKATPGFLPDQLFLTDRVRWDKESR